MGPFIDIPYQLPPENLVRGHSGGGGCGDDGGGGRGLNLAFGFASGWWGAGLAPLIRSLMSQCSSRHFRCVLGFFVLSCLERDYVIYIVSRPKMCAVSSLCRWLMQVVSV